MPENAELETIEYTPAKEVEEAKHEIEEVEYTPAKEEKALRDKAEYETFKAGLKQKIKEGGGKVYEFSKATASKISKELSKPRPVEKPQKQQSFRYTQSRQPTYSVPSFSDTFGGYGTPLKKQVYKTPSIAQTFGMAGHKKYSTPNPLGSLKFNKKAYGFGSFTRPKATRLRLPKPFFKLKLPKNFKL